tara:strand:+ start:2219 stop:2848 length:630 start_codon:yes stop_codon:yes gene_type:complete
VIFFVHETALHLKLASTHVNDMRRPTADGQGKPVFTFSGVATGDVGSDVNNNDRHTPKPPPTRMAHRAVACDVTLQVLLANNVWFSVCYWCATVISTFVKTAGAYKDYDDIRPIMLGIYTAFEPIRLYMGYSGNLQEKVPLLWGFVAITGVIALPLAAYFWFGQEDVTAFDMALNTTFMAIIAAECVFGMVAARKVLKEQSLAFFEGER